MPHEEEDFPLDQREFLLRSSAVFVGPIVDLHDYPKGNTRKNILITLGSGAGISLNFPLFSAVDSFLEFLRKNSSWIDSHCVDIDIVAGPFYEGGCDFSGFAVRSTTNNLTQDMYKSKIVISGSGYNTINEIVSTKTPAVLVPLSRGWDDQFQRAENLEKLGCVKVANENIVGAIHDILGNWESYHKKFPSIKSGNMQAAKMLSQMLSQKTKG